MPLQVCVYSFSKIRATQHATSTQPAGKSRSGGGSLEEGLPLVERRNGEARP